MMTRVQVVQVLKLAKKGSIDKIKAG